MTQWQHHIAHAETSRVHDTSAKVVEVPVPVVQEEIVHAGFPVRKWQWRPQIFEESMSVVNNCLARCQKSSQPLGKSRCDSYSA